MASICPARNANRRQTLGQLGETLAASFLSGKGWRVLDYNWRPPGKLRGEIDLIAIDGDQVVFVEVKTRRSHGYGRPEEAVGWQKQRQLIRLAQAWLAQRGGQQLEYRIDVIAVVILGRQARLRHIKYAIIG